MKPNTTTASTGKIAPLGLRMLPELRALIESAARESGRSMNAEIAYRLIASFKPPERLYFKDLQQEESTTRAEMMRVLGLAP